MGGELTPYFLARVQRGLDTFNGRVLQSAKDNSVNVKFRNKRLVPME